MVLKFPLKTLAHRICASIVVLLCATGIRSDVCTWEKVSELAGEKVNYITGAHHLFVAAGDGVILTHRSDETEWRKHRVVKNISLDYATWCGDRYLVTGDSGTICISPDGEEWIKAAVGMNVRVTSVAYGNGIFVATGREPTSGESCLLTSVDASEWTVRTLPDPYSVAYDGNRFVVIGESSLTIMISADGADWEMRQISSSSWCFESTFPLMYGNGLFVASGSTILGYPKTRRVIVEQGILVSDDGSTWDARYTGAYSCLPIYTANRFVLINRNQIVLTSRFQIFDTLCSNDTVMTFRSAACSGDGLFMAAATNGDLYASSYDTSALSTHADRPAPAAGSNIFAIIPNGLAIHIPPALSRRHLKVRIFTLAGKVVYSSEHDPDNGCLTIPDHTLPAGFHFLSLSEGRRTVLYEGFILNR